MKCIQCERVYGITGDSIPMVLVPCSHTICKGCSDKFEVGQRCPTCRRRISENPRVNYALQDILTSQPTGFHRCENCDQSVASHYCYDCNVRLCVACMDFLHSMRALRGHLRCKLAEMPPADLCGVAMLRKRLEHVEQQRDEAWEEVRRVKGEAPQGATGDAGASDAERTLKAQLEKQRVIDQALLSCEKFQPQRSWTFPPLHPSPVGTVAAAVAEERQPPQEDWRWLAHGHSWIGQRVLRDFGEYGTVAGTLKHGCPLARMLRTSQPFGECNLMTATMKTLKSMKHSRHFRCTTKGRPNLSPSPNKASVVSDGSAQSHKLPHGDLHQNPRRNSQSPSMQASQ